ncbi:MAG TPA: LamG domain-containing protein, partial [Polyangia bacterium]|nr:LamG domain-containing protein [Polyangia bacterium]
PVLPPIPDLVAYWKLDESTPGARAADATGNGNNAGPANAPMPAGPAPGLAFANPHSLSFNTSGGTINQCALITTAPRLTFVGAITMSAWIKPMLTTASHQIIAHGSGTAETGLQIDTNTYVAYSRNNLRHAATFAVPREDVADWVHIVGTHDGTAWRLYRNGNQVAVTEDDVGALFSNGYWSLGSSSNCAIGFFQGSLDDVRLYRRALRPEEVRQLTNGAEF